MTSREIRKQTLKSAVKLLESHHNYSCLEELRSGTYGDIVKVCNRQTGDLKAAKVISNGNVSEKELLLWPILNHKNILPTEDVIITEIGTVIVIMPYKFIAMDEILTDEIFDCFEQNFIYAKKWIMDVLRGLQYLHSLNICHLDLKLDNVLLDEEGSAVLCDFTFINSTVYPLPAKYLGLPDIYRPPELMIENMYYDGKSFDLWAVGVLTIEAFTKQLLFQQRNNFYMESGVALFLRFLLKESVFGILIKDCFVLHSFENAEISAAVNFIKGFIRIDPLARTSAEKALQHPFFNGVEEIIISFNDIYDKNDLRQNFEDTAKATNRRMSHPSKRLLKQDNQRIHRTTSKISLFKAYKKARKRRKQIQMVFAIQAYIQSLIQYKEYEKNIENTAEGILSTLQKQTLNEKPQENDNCVEKYLALPLEDAEQSVHVWKLEKKVSTVVDKCAVNSCVEDVETSQLNMIEKIQDEFPGASGDFCGRKPSLKSVRIERETNRRKGFMKWLFCGCA